MITALANNSTQVERFITEAGRTATATATQQNNLRGTFQNLPATLEQLRPAMAKLATTVTTNTPVLNNLNAASGQIKRLLTDLPAFSRSARPAIKSLGQASVTGRTAVKAAAPTVADLNRFAKPTPELAGNLAIVLHDLDDPSRAVEPDPRSPGGTGFTGLQALLGYVFNQTLAVNYYGPQGHLLGVDAFYSSMCSNYATPATIALALKQYGAQYRQCYSWLGPNQPGVNETDPSDPSAPVPDPGGAPPGQTGPRTSAARLTAADVNAANAAAAAAKSGSSASTSTSSTSTTPASTGATIPTSAGSATSGSGSSTPTTGTGPTTPPIDLHKTIGQILSTLGGGSGSSASTGAAPSTGQTQALLNYLLTP